MTQRPILLVGASVRWAAQSAFAAGVEVFALDRFGDRDTLAACRQHRTWLPEQSVAAAVRAWPAVRDAVVVPVGGSLAGPGALESARAAAVPDPSWHCLRRWARHFGLGFPETMPAGQLVEPTRRPTGAWLIKQPASTGGLGVWQADQGVASMARRRTGGAVDCPKDDALWQRRLFGQSYGLVALADGRHVRLLGNTRSMHVRRSVAGATLPFVYAGSRGPCCHQGAFAWTSLHQLAQRVADETGLRGLFNIDWLRDRDGRCWVLEVNARPSASCEVLERHRQATAAAAGRAVLPSDSLMWQHLVAIGALPAASTEESEESEPSWGTGQRWYHLKRIVYARQAGWMDLEPLRQQAASTGKMASSRREVAREDRRRGGREIRVQLADLPAPGAAFASGEPVLTLLIDASAESIGNLGPLWRRWTKDIQAAIRPRRPD